MWPVPRLNDALVSITFSPENVVCSWIEKEGDLLDRLVLKAYKRFPLKNRELDQLIVFNPTSIRTYICSFLKTYSLEDAFIVFAFDGRGINEQFITLPTSTAQPDDFDMPPSSSCVWKYDYVYPHDDGQSVFYICTLSRSSLLQYQLLAIAAECNLIAITSQTHALLTLYKNVFGSAFRKSQLAVDMMRIRNRVAELISYDIIKRMVKIPNALLVDELQHIAVACGLFYGTRGKV